MSPYSHPSHGAIAPGQAAPSRPGAGWAQPPSRAQVVSRTSTGRWYSPVVAAM